MISDEIDVIYSSKDPAVDLSFYHHCNVKSISYRDDHGIKREITLEDMKRSIAVFMGYYDYKPPQSQKDLKIKELEAEKDTLDRYLHEIIEGKNTAINNLREDRKAMIDRMNGQAEEIRQLKSNIRNSENQPWPAHKLNHDAISDCCERFNKEIEELKEKVKALEDKHRGIPDHPENYTAVDCGPQFGIIWIPKDIGSRPK